MPGDVLLREVGQIAAGIDVQTSVHPTPARSATALLGAHAKLLDLARESAAIGAPQVICVVSVKYLF